MSFSEALGYIERHCPVDEHEQHYVLVLVEHGDSPDKTIVSKRPLIYIRTFISLVRELSK